VTSSSANRQPNSVAKKNDLRNFGILLTLVMIGFALRVWMAIRWQNAIVGDELFRFGDSDSYWMMATKIGQGLPYQYGGPDSRIFRAPLYPLFLSPWTWLEGSSVGSSRSAVLAARIAGCALGALCIALVMRLAKRLMKNRDGLLTDAGLWAGLFAALYPGAIGMSIFILSEAVFCPLLLVSLGCAGLAILSQGRNQWEVGWTWMLISGATSGAACLARPSWSLWPAVLFSYLLFMVWTLQKRGTATSVPKVKWALNCLLFCLGIGLIMCPWWVRNYQVTGKFVPTTLQVGASLYDGWHAGASGSSDESMEFVNAYIVEQKKEDLQNTLAGKRLESTLEWRLDRRLRNAAIRWAMENSSDAASLGLVKLIKTWSPLPVAKELGSDAVRWFEAIGYSSIMFFALVGLWKCRLEVGAWLYAMPCVYFALLHMFFIGSVRYRQPAVLALCVLAGVGCAASMKWIFREKQIDEAKCDGTIATSNVTDDEREP
jgi:hypothetical protein